MFVESHFSSYYDREISTTVLHLKFNNTHTMILALPEKGLDTLEDVICKDHVSKWRKWMQAKYELDFLYTYGWMCIYGHTARGFFK